MSAAQQAAESFGIPPELFWAICEYLETHPVQTDNPHYRYSPNTRALALRASRLLFMLRHED